MSPLATRLRRFDATNEVPAIGRRNPWRTLARARAVLAAAEALGEPRLEAEARAAARRALALVAAVWPGGGREG